MDFALTIIVRVGFYRCRFCLDHHCKSKSLLLWILPRSLLREQGSIILDFNLTIIVRVGVRCCRFCVDHRLREWEFAIAYFASIIVMDFASIAIAGVGVHRYGFYLNCHYRSRGQSLQILPRPLLRGQESVVVYFVSTIIAGVEVCHCRFCLRLLFHLPKMGSPPLSSREGS